MTSLYRDASIKNIFNHIIMYEELIKKYELDNSKKKFLMNFLTSYIDTFKPRYGYVDFNRLYDYGTPLYFENCLRLCSEITQNDDSICNELAEFYKQLFLYPGEEENIFKINLHNHLVTDFSSLIGKNFHHQSEKVDFSFLKYGQSIFVIEKLAHTIKDILIVLPNHNEKQDLYEQEENFLQLLKHLYKDFYSLKK